MEPVKVTALCYGPIGLEHECLVHSDTELLNIETPLSSSEWLAGVRSRSTYRFIGEVDGKAIYVRRDD